jgi:hypothetical protein
MEQKEKDGKLTLKKYEIKLENLQEDNKIEIKNIY